MVIIVTAFPIKPHQVKFDSSEVPVYHVSATDFNTSGITERFTQGRPGAYIGAFRDGADCPSRNPALKDLYFDQKFFCIEIDGSGLLVRLQAVKAVTVSEICFDLRG